MNEPAPYIDFSPQQSLQSDNVPVLRTAKLYMLKTDPTPEELAEPPSPPFSILKAYLHSSSDPNKVALDLVKPLLHETILDLDRNDPMGAQLYPWTMFCEIYSFVEQLQYDHPWIERLVELMEAFRNQPTPPTAVCVAHNIIYADVEFTWHKFPTFLSQQRDDFQYKTRYGRTSNSTWSRQEWLSMNQFLSLLVAREVAEPWTTERLAIAGFGAWYHKNQGKELRCTKDDHALRPGESDGYTGPADLCNERWAFWQAKLEEFARRGDLSEEARVWAFKAATFMASLD